MLKGIIPTVFYADIETGIAFFCAGLGFMNVYRADDDSLCIVRREDATVHLVRNAEVARQDRPQLRLPTDDIEGYHREIVGRSAHVLHPNGRTVTEKPWGRREFAMLCPSGVCVIVEQPIGGRP